MRNTGAGNAIFLVLVTAQDIVTLGRKRMIEMMMLTEKSRDRQ